MKQPEAQWKRFLGIYKMFQMSRLFVKFIKLRNVGASTF